MRGRAGGVDQHRLGGAADAGAPQLGVLDDGARHGEVRIPVHEHMTHAFEMSDDRHTRFLLHARHETLAAARHDHVDVIRHRRQQVADGRAIGGRHELDAGGRQAGSEQPFDEAGVDGATRMHALGAAAQDGGIAGLQAQTTGIAGHVRPALVDDADHAQRHAHARDVEAVGTRPLRDGGADGIGQRGYVLDSPCHALDSSSIEREAIEHGAGQALGARRLQILRVGR